MPMASFSCPAAALKSKQKTEFGADITTWPRIHGGANLAAIVLTMTSSHQSGVTIVLPRIDETAQLQQFMIIIGRHGTG